MTLAALIELLVAIAGPDCRAPCRARAAALAPLLIQAAPATIWSSSRGSSWSPRRAGGPDEPGTFLSLLAAVAWRESSYRPDAVNARTGAHGIMGLNPSPTADPARWCSDLDARTVDGNVRCGAVILRRALAKCGTVEGALSRYRGHKCRRSEYSDAVLARMP